MFLPQAVMAVAAPLMGAWLGRRLGIKRVYLLGLVADLTAMGLLVASQFMRGTPFVYGLLLLATGSLGIGFGLTVPALNTYANAFFPDRADSAVLILNALLGAGTALAPVFVTLFVKLGIWWGLPLFVAALLLGLLAFSLSLPLQVVTDYRERPGQAHGAVRPPRFWIYAGFVFLYGIVETMNGNWVTLYMRESLGATIALASLALTIFWATTTGGRLLFAAVERWVPQTRTYQILPVVAAAALVVIASLPAGTPWLGVLAVGLAGLGCSALLPLTISFGQKELTAMATSVAGGLIAFYQMGYGVAAFGVGPLHDAGLKLHVIFGATTVVALAMAALARLVVRPHPN